MTGQNEQSVPSRSQKVVTLATVNIEVMWYILKITVDMFLLQNINATLTTIKKRQLKQFLLFRSITG